MAAGQPHAQFRPALRPSTACLLVPELVSVVSGLLASSLSMEYPIQWLAGSRLRPCRPWQPSQAVSPFWPPNSQRSASLEVEQPGSPRRGPHRVCIRPFRKLSQNIWWMGLACPTQALVSPAGSER